MKMSNFWKLGQENINKSDLGILMMYYHQVIHDI